MLGVNLSKVASLIGKSAALKALCGINSPIKIILNQVNKALLEREIDLLKVLVRNIATQNTAAYDEIEKIMRENLPEEEFRIIFGE